jgi:hypothetical protein
MLIDVAAYVRTVPRGDVEAAVREIEALKQAVRDREQRCVDQLLAVHRFRADDVAGEWLPIEDGRWGMDLFSPEAMKLAGTRMGSAAAAGAMVGLTLDIMLAGLSLGTGTAAGAVIGGALGAARTHGRRLLDRARGLTELRCDDATVGLLYARQIMLVKALLSRGHAAMTATRLPDPEAGLIDRLPRRLPEPLRRARVQGSWSAIAADGDSTAPTDPARQQAITELAALLAGVIVQPGPSSTRS